MKLTDSRRVVHRDGFTLLEILIAIFILVTVLSTVFASYTGTFRITGETESQAEIYQMARIAFERFVEDLECLYLPESEDIEEPAEEEEQSLEFEGKENEIDGRSADTLRFASRAHVVFGDQDLPCGTAKISYYVEQDDETDDLVLYRSDIPSLEPTSDENGVAGLCLCERLLSVDFTYYDADGEKYDSWEPSSEKGTPQMVSISLEFVNPSDPETPLKFVTSIGLPTNKKKEKKGW